MDPDVAGSFADDLDALDSTAAEITTPNNRTALGGVSVNEDNRKEGNPVGDRGQQSRDQASRTKTSAAAEALAANLEATKQQTQDAAANIVDAQETQASVTQDAADAAADVWLTPRPAVLGV